MHLILCELAPVQSNRLTLNLMTTDYSLLLYCGAFGSEWSWKLHTIQLNIELRNWRRLEYQRMHKFYNLEGNGTVIDDPSILCLALLHNQSPNKHLAHVKIDPLGTFSNKLSRSQSDFSDELMGTSKLAKWT